jgi:hypothetical protein
MMQFRNIEKENCKKNLYSCVENKRIPTQPYDATLKGPSGQIKSAREWDRGNCLFLVIHRYM